MGGIGRLSLGLILLGLASCQQAVLPGLDDAPPLPKPLRAEAAAGPACSADIEHGLGDLAHIRTVQNPEAAKRPISLAECIALALENGRTAEFYDIAGSDRWSSVTGLTRQMTAATASDSLRVFAFDPPSRATESEESLSRFDVIWDTGLFWNRINTPSRNLSTTPSDLEQLTLNNQYDNVAFRTGLLKPLATGGLAGISFTSGYLFQPFLPGTAFVNPAYTPAVSFTLEQPLFRNAGVEINQLLDSHPGGIRNSIPPGGRVPGILLARIGTEQATLEFERRVHELVFRVQEAYWGLYGAYWELYTRDNGLKQAHQAWQIAKARYDAKGLAIEDLAMAEEQYHFFRTQRLEAMGRGVPGRPGVLEAERRLRYVVGLPAEDGTRLVPTDEPMVEAVDPCWDGAWQEAAQNRPELRQVFTEIQATELELTKARNLLKPDLRLISRYSVNGLGNTVGGGINNLAWEGRPEWEVGVQAQVPLGFREANAEVTRAKLQLAQRIAFLRDQEQKLTFSLQRSYRDLVQYRAEVQTRRSQKEAAEVQLQARFQKYKAGGDAKRPDASLDLLLRAQRGWSDAVRDEAIALCNYRVALADFERQKGTILRDHNVMLADGPTPLNAHAEASSYIRQWTERCGAAHSEFLNLEER